MFPDLPEVAVPVGITVFGPPPASLLPAVNADALREAVRGELSGYWKAAVGKPWLWLDDGCVDLGLVTLARVEATLTEGRLITKREPADLAREIGRRRRGEAFTVGRCARVRRAHRARRIMHSGIRSLLAA